MKKKRKGREAEPISDYDRLDTSTIIDPSRPLRFENLGLKLPATQPTQVISIRLPSELLNEIKAIGSQKDIPYQALIKLFLSESVADMKKRSA